MLSPASLVALFSFLNIIGSVHIVNSTPLSPPLVLPATPSSISALSLNAPNTTYENFTAWPSSPRKIPISHFSPTSWLCFIRSGPTQPALDQQWLLAAIDHQLSEYTRQTMPHGFNIYNEKWRFHMQPAGNPFELTMPMAVRALQFYRELVEKYGMADMAFALGTAEAGSETVVVKAYYWVTEIDGQPTLPPTTSGNTTTTTTTTNNNNSSLSNHPKWPPAPLMFSIPNTHPQAQLTFIRVDCEHPQTPADTAWLLGAIYHQLSVYGQERHPQGFNFFTERLRFYMQMGEPAMDMGLAVMAMEVFRGLVETWGVATVVFYVQVEHEYRGYYWVFNRDEDAVAEA